MKDKLRFALLSATESHMNLSSKVDIIAEALMESDFFENEDFVTPQMFGAKADGITDDTEAIQLAFNSLTDGGILYFPKGKYIVKHNPVTNGEDYIAVLVENKSGITVLFDNGATIKHNLTDVGRYSMFTFENCDGLEIKGGIIEGDKNEHTPISTGYGSKGINLKNCTNIYIHDMKVWNIFGDCIGVSGTTKQSENILIENCTLHDSYRNGITIGGVKRGTVRNCHIYNVSGGDPQAGIDIEAEYGFNNEDITVEGCYIHDCNKNTVTVNSNSYNTTVRKCILNGNVGSSETSDNLTLENTSISEILNVRNNVTVKRCILKGLWVYGSTNYPNAYIEVFDTVITGNTTDTTININKVTGMLHFKNCVLNHLENSVKSLFFIYQSNDMEIVAENCTFNLGNQPTINYPFATNPFASFKMFGCTIVGKSETMEKSIIRCDAKDFHMVNCLFDMTAVKTCTPGVIGQFGSSVSTVNCLGNQVLCHKTDTTLFSNFLDLAYFKGKACLTGNNLPTVAGMYVKLGSGGEAFVTANILKEA